MMSGCVGRETWLVTQAAALILAMSHRNMGNKVGPTFHISFSFASSSLNPLIYFFLYFRPG
jgi:hypothetical protein